MTTFMTHTTTIVK